MSSRPRWTGTEGLGEVPWGTHFCQFYATRADLLDIVVPYLKAGLENDEHCIWVTSPPLSVDDAWAALARAVPDLERHRRRGRVEIAAHTEWYLPEGGFNAERMLRRWGDQVERALAAGAAGVRRTGDLLWLEQSVWEEFGDYETALNTLVGQYQVLVLCTCPLDRFSGAELADVIRNHQFAVLKRAGNWEIIARRDRLRMEDALVSERERLRISEERLRLAQRAANAGTWELNVETGDALWSEELWKLYGLDPNSQRPCYDLWLQTVHPEDQTNADRAFHEAKHRGTELDLEWRVIRGDGTVRWLMARGQPLLDRQGKTTRYIGIVIDITERKAAELEREKLVGALREADRRKNQFLAALSHELRNPLAPIRNSVLILERAAPGSDQARRALSIVDRQVGQLTRIIDDLLDVNRIARNKIPLRRQRLDLNEMVRRTVEDYRFLFERAGVQIEMRPADGPLVVNGDGNRLAQAVGNLLQNAAKFTPAGGQVVVSVVNESAARAAIRVADTGVGMTPAVQAVLFEPFTQAETSLDRGTGGLGLGLALVKGLIDLHGGQVEAKSEGPGRGSEFIVHLPLEAGEMKSAGAEPPGAAKIRRRVLIIEDNADAAESLRELLELDEHIVTVACNGPEGIAKARAFEPDVVLCDIGLPGMDGYEVARAFRADPRLRDVRLVALTGYALPDDLRRSHEAGFDRHVAKPPSPEKLVAILDGEGGQRTTRSS